MFALAMQAPAPEAPSQNPAEKDPVLRASNQVQLVLVWNRKRGPAIPALERLVELLLLGLVSARVWDEGGGGRGARR